MDERRIAAIHEAGHVAIRCANGLATSSLIIYEDGTGITIAGDLTSDLSIQLDIALGGMVAEDLHSDRAHAPTSAEIDDAVDDLANEDFDPDYYGDLEQAVKFFQSRHPNSTSAEIFVAIQSSYLRCLRVLQGCWNIVLQIAEQAITSHNGIVTHDAIEAIWNSRRPQASSNESAIDVP